MFAVMLLRSSIKCYLTSYYDIPSHKIYTTNFRQTYLTQTKLKCLPVNKIYWF